MNTKNAREQVVDLLMEIEKDKTYAQLLLKQALNHTEPKSKPFITEVVYGTLKYRLKLDYIINSFSKTPIRKMKPLIRNVMRMSVYQMFYLDKVPVSAVINEAVNIVKKRKFGNLSGFINGVLREIDRNKEKIAYPDKNKDLTGYLSIIYAIPDWIIKEWLAVYPEDLVEKICSALNERARVCIRINTLCTSKKEVMEILNQENILFEPGNLLDEALYIKQVDNLQNLSSFKEGMWTVQDESAMLVAKVVRPKPGEHILDMCSAPGGKSIHMAELMQNKGEIISADVHAHKLELIEKNAKRMGVDIIKPVLQDGTLFRKEWIGAFDRVLLDAPCSGLGIMKRKPDIRYSKSLQDLKGIVQLQKALVNHAVKYVKEGGVLVYSTCTLSKPENEEMASYIADELGLELYDIADTIPKELHAYIKNQGMVQILPFVADTDGFFIAAFKKKRI
ncbi:16S rRNA (cytosine(967)-C(5))-methyltransferase RsmB [Cellulosilyticum sp. I15G10I2]|uniref:16S rRNA (cytosine(967)-C(5))-methyltransferase RsmB n=1 Tax=Cellulosilyticum sp. I15G10I2 TaxID=1892843 RepID=UPI00085BD651|nr:16S rRNA (cytosine(967)-C(5))-methyltransferase RsmB [Cellulosilyticum sp. I15G10I2]